MTVRRRLAMMFLALLTSLAVFSVVVWLPDMQAEAVIDRLQAQVVREMSGLPFLPQQTCALFPTNDNQAEDAYAQARANTLAHVLAAPQAQGLGTHELFDLFSSGVEIATGTEDGAFVIDEHGEYLLASMKLPVCARRHKYYYLPQLYVFSQTGDFWSLGLGIIHDIEWIEDRWVGMMRLQIDEGRERYAFIHVIQKDGEWQLRMFNNVPNGPGLMYLPSPIMVDYSKGYDKLSISSDYGYGPLPCDFDDALIAQASRTACLDCVIRASYAVYRGTFTFVWTGDNYALTDETPYQITIILSDNTILEEDAPTEAELAEKSPFLRPGSWHGYCQPLFPQKEDFHE